MENILNQKYKEKDIIKYGMSNILDNINNKKKKLSLGKKLWVDRPSRISQYLLDINHKKLEHELFTSKEFKQFVEHCDFDFSYLDSCLENYKNTSKIENQQLIDFFNSDEIKKITNYTPQKKLKNLEDCLKFITSYNQYNQIKIPNSFSEKVNNKIGFLSKNSSLPKINEIPNMEIGVNLCTLAIKDNKKIAIVGDYDADGCCGTAILLNFFKQINTDYVFRIPNRLKEGYGITPKIVDELKDCYLIITVDNGSTAHEAAERARKYGIKFIALDHHCLQSPISIDALINPQLEDGNPFQILCGAAIAFFFRNFLIDKLDLNLPKKQDVDLVAIASVCDMVPLIGVNRKIVNSGLKMMQDSKHNSVVFNIINYLKEKEMEINLRKFSLEEKDLNKIQLMDTSTYNLIDTQTIGFKLGPLINACGRMGEAEVAIELLTGNRDRTEILYSLNENRKNVQEFIMSDIKKINELNKNNFKEGYWCNDYVGIYYGPSWHIGVLGIIASKIKDESQKTIFILAGQERVFASARSMNNFHVGEFIELLVNNQIVEYGGGHKQAGGFTMSPNNIDKLIHFLSDFCIKNTDSLNSISEEYIDSYLSIQAIEEVGKIKSKLEPFGQSNEEPVFCWPRCKIIYSQKLKSNTGKMQITQNFKDIISAVGFNLGDLIINLSKNKSYDIIGNVKYSTYSKKYTISCIDIRHSQ